MVDKVFDKLVEAYEHGLKGRVESFDLWLDNLGIDAKLFALRNLVRVLAEKTELTVDREEELASVVEFIGFYKRQRNTRFHLPIIGVKGVGKSHMLNVLRNFLEKTEKDLPWNYVNAQMFTRVEEEQEEHQSFLVFLDELKSKQYEILLIDSCERDKNIAEALCAIFRHFQKGVLITSWTPYHWDFERDRIEEFFPASKEIRIGPFSSEVTAKFLSTVFQLVSRGGYSLKEELSALIHEYSGGIPRNILTVLLRSYHEAFNSKKTDIDEESVKAAARFLGLDGVSERISQLADHQLLILRHLLLEYDERGTRPSKLVEILGKDKATISYHLNELSKQRLLVSNRIGRWVFYRVRDEVAPLVGLRLIQEADFLG
jgi:DNA-binding transcriptional ArsR family regulator